MNATPQIPDHTLLRLIGRGSYGEVWLARNVMGAGRAVKIVRRASFDSDRPYEREFAAVRRYEPASRMADGLVNVLHVGRCEAEGLFYYVMELADSDSGSGDEESYQPRTLRSVMEKQPRLPLADCVAVAQSLVQALASLHRTGLTHRDIKPSNIIFVNHRAKLADVGLVSDLGESRSFVGTEGYIPPEGPGLPGADLYALGMVLYEMASGCPPADYPRVPPEWMAVPEGPEMEFVEVVLRATEPDAARRYQAAGELQADLALLESGKSVRRVLLLERRWRAAKRGAAVAAAVALLIGGGLWLWHDTELREQRAVSAEALAAQARADEGTQRFLALRERAAARVRSELAGWRRGALSDIDEAAKLNPGDLELRNTLITALSRADVTDGARWSQPGDESAGPVMSDDMTLVAVAEKDGSFRILRTADGSEVQHVRHWLPSLPPFFESCFTPGGRYFGVRFRGRRTLQPVAAKEFLYECFTWFRVSDGRTVLELPGSAGCRGGVLADGRHVFAWNPAARALIRYDLDYGREASRIPLATGVISFFVSPDETRILVQTDGDDYGGSLELVDAATGSRLSRWTGLAFMRGAAAWTPDSQRILLGSSASPHGVLVLTADGTGAAPERLMLHSSQVVDLAVSPDGRHLLSSSWDQTTLLTDLALRRTVAILPGMGHAGSLGFSRDGRACWRRMVEGRQSTELITGTFEPSLTTLLPVPGVVNGAAFSADGRWLAAAWGMGMIMHDFAAGRSDPAANPGPTSCCAFTGDSSRPVCVAATAAGLRLVSPQTDSTGRTAWTAGEPFSQGQINVITAADDGRQIIAWGGSADGIRVVNGNPAPWSALRQVVSAATSADGRISVCSRGGGKALILLDAAGDQKAEIPGLSQPWVAISPDGTRVSANSVRNVHCWDTASQKLLWERPKDFPFIRCAPVHTPDGRFVIVRTGLHPAVLDAATGDTLAVLAPAFPAHIHSTTLSPDGSRFAACGRNFVLIWEWNTIQQEMQRRGMWRTGTSR